MPRHSKIAESPPAAVRETLERLGANIRTARVRRKLTQEDIARRMGVSRFVVADVEKGKPTTGVAAYMGALWVLGLLPQMKKIADPGRDEEGLTLERARGPKTARHDRTLGDDF